MEIHQMRIFKIALIAAVGMTLIACSPTSEETDAIIVEPTLAPTVATHVATPFPVGSGQGVFLSITDIHLDPFTVPSIVPRLDSQPVSQWHSIFRSAGAEDFVGYGQDAGYPLMMSALEQASNLGLSYDYILYSGDYLAHGFRAKYEATAGSTPVGYEQFVVKTVSFVGEMLESEIGTVPIMGVLGNNDAFCGDYWIADGSPLFADIERQWARLSQDPGRFGGFGTGGYYKLPHPTVPDLDIIALDNVYWSRSYESDHYPHRCSPASGSPGGDVMTWLSQAVATSETAQRRVQILMHIPPGIDAWSTAHNGTGSCESQIALYWDDPFASEFESLVQNHPGVISRVFAGHTHMDSFSVLTDASGAPGFAINVTPSVSPYFDNNPAFTVYLYDLSSGEILNSATYNLTNLDAVGRGASAIWQLEYVFDHAYGVSDLSATELASAAAQIASDPSLQSQFVSYYGASTGQTLEIDSNPLAFTCQQTALTRANFAACYCDG
jgi:sphingomyelin phosphodiesterase acid-like 3